MKFALVTRDFLFLFVFARLRVEIRPRGHRRANVAHGG